MRASLIAALATLATAAPAAAQEPGSLFESVDGPTQMKPIASGFDRPMGYERMWVDSHAPFRGDQERWITWPRRPPPAEPGSVLLDTLTMTTREVPECRLGYGLRGVFAADCPGLTPRAALYDAQTGEIRPLRGALKGDTFHWIGEHWVAGDDLHACENAGKCHTNAVFVNRHTGERLLGESPYDPEAVYTLDKPALERRRLRYDPRKVQGDLSIARKFRRPLRLRQRGRPPVVLAGNCRGAFTTDRCGGVLAERRVTWTIENHSARAPAATVNGYVADTGARARWTFRFRPDKRFACQGNSYGAYVMAFHTAHAVLAVAVDGFEEDPPGGRCYRYPSGFTLYAAPWPAA